MKLRKEISVIVFRRPYVISYERTYVDMHKSNLHSGSFKNRMKKKDFVVYRELNNKEANNENSRA